METIKVNMNPNPLDVQTIHASQNDGEARQWEFKLHNNGELIDTSDVKEQLVFKAYKGGTEQLLPENGSTPTTSPFLGDIRYPQGLLTDQEFTYRQSPTEEDGLAKITDIKGNTLVWNQLVENGDFSLGTNGYGQGGGRSSLTVADGIGTATLINTVSSSYQNYSPVELVQGHKVYIHYDFKVPKTVSLFRTIENNNTSLLIDRKENVTPNVWHSVDAVYTIQVGGRESLSICYMSGLADAGYVLGDQYQFKNLMCVDLTQMFGSGNEPTSVEQFTSLFPLSYYSFNQGSLLSFNGNGIKTVGFNLFDPTSETINAYLKEITSNNVRWPYEADSRSVAIRCFPNTTYCVYANGLMPSILRVCSIADELPSGTGWDIQCEKQFVNSTTGMTIFTTGANAKYLIVQSNKATFENVKANLCISVSSDKNGTYEPYTENTTNLPVATYFPTGMKSAGNVYDELTESKAITRIGSVDLGTLDWTDRSSTATGLFSVTDNTISYAFKQSVKAVCAKYPYFGTVVSATQAGGLNDKIIALYYNETGSNHIIYLKGTSFSDVASLKSALSGVYLYYELATPTETSFTTASLVTENAEIPLSNNDGVLLGKCTEELSENPGFIDAKIKLADSDGECYSNKIQLHIERSPQ